MSMRELTGHDVVAHEVRGASLAEAMSEAAVFIAAKEADFKTVKIAHEWDACAPEDEKFLLFIFVMG